MIYCHIEDEKGRIQVTGNNDKKLLNLLYEAGICSWLLDTDPLTAQSLNNGNMPNTSPVEQKANPFFSQNTSSFGQRTDPSFSQNTSPFPPNVLPPGQRTDPSFSQNTSSFGQRTDPSFSQNTSPFPPNVSPFEQRANPSFAHMQPQPASNSGMKSMSRRLFSDVPRMSATTGPEILQTLSRRHRRVLALVDGRRSAEKIAALLFPTPKDAWIALTLLQEMESMGIITWENR